MKPHYELRRSTMLNVKNDTKMHELPVVMTGSLAKIREWANKRGLFWRRDSNVFGGYYANHSGLVVYYIT
jgi:hypothetical protein